MELNLKSRCDRFVSSDKSSTSDEISDKDLQRMCQAILSFFEWFPPLLKYRQEVSKELVENEELINTSTSEVLKRKLIIAKNFVDVGSSIQKNIHTYRQHLPQLISMANSKISLELSKSHEAGAKVLLQQITKLRYPLIRYYTTTEGMKFWFSKQIKFSQISRTEKRKMQYFKGPLLYSENLKSSQREEMLEMFRKSNINDNRTVREHIRTIYKKCESFVKDMFLTEFHDLCMSRPDLNFTGMIYRGEYMKKEDFENLIHRIQSSILSDTQLICELNLDEFASASCDPRVAKKFLYSGNAGENTVKILHKIHVAEPSDEEINQFELLFPGMFLTKTYINVEKFSEFPGEKEILSYSMSVHIFDVSQDDHEIWIISSIGCGLSYRGKSLSEEDLEVFADALVEQDSHTILALLARNPDIVAYMYSTILIQLTIVTLALENHVCLRNDRDFYETIKEDSMSHLKFLKSILGKS